MPEKFWVVGGGGGGNLDFSVYLSPLLGRKETCKGSREVLRERERGEGERGEGERREGERRKERGREEKGERERGERRGERLRQ